MLRCFKAPVRRIKGFVASNHTKGYLSTGTATALDHGATIPSDTLSSSSSNLPIEKTKIALEKSIKKLGKIEESLAQNFAKTDLILLQTGLAEIQLVIRQQFADHPFWKLFWSADYLAGDLEGRIGRQQLLRAEYQMSFATGKIAGCMSELNSLLKSTLEPSKDLLVQSSNTTHHLVANEIDHLLADQDESAATNPDETGAPTIQRDAVDPFILRNLVATHSAADFTDLSKRIQNLVRIQSISQIALLFLWTFSVHFGVPLVMAVPAGLFSSASGLFWMKIKYAALEKSFLNKVRGEQKRLLSSVQDAHYAAITGATQPYRRVLGTIRSALVEIDKKDL